MPFEKGKSGNPSGRPRNSKNKVPTDAAIKDGFKKGSPEALNKIMSIMRNSENEANVIKAAFKILDTSISIVMEEDKLKVKKAKADGSSEEYTAENDKEEGGSVVKFLRK